MEGWWRGTPCWAVLVVEGEQTATEWLAKGGGRAPTGLLGDSSNPRGMPTSTSTHPPPPPLLSLPNPTYNQSTTPLPAAVCLTVKTTAPVASQAPSPLLDLRLFLSSHHPLLHPPLCLHPLSGQEPSPLRDFLPLLLL